ncbi:hypothetical protein ID866_9591, partial [Astraeus odoratus]
MHPFRPIAPAPHSHSHSHSPSLDPHHNHAHDPPSMEIYAASCNPPRRAKRVRSDSIPSSYPQPQPLHEPSSPSLDNPDDDDPYDLPQPSPPKRRGRKPGTMSRAAREAQRKINHSLIEKARRTKINDALATLRQLVPADYKRPSADDHPQDESDEDEDHPSAGNGGAKSKQPKSKGTGEKEFKLEILVRTVSYLQDLSEKVKTLERDGCPHCNRSISCFGEDMPAIRRTGSVVHESRPVDGDDTAHPPHPTTTTSRLPSISTWLPMLTPSQSPSCDLPANGSPAWVPPNAAVGSNVTPSHQLPTPPTSATFAPSAMAAIPPILTLPSPKTSLPVAPVRAFPSGFTRPNAGASAGVAASGSGSVSVSVSVSGGNGKGSPAASPVYTHDDE